MPRRALLLVLLACLFGACPASRPRHPNLLFVAIDTLRADRLGCQGNPRGLTPNIDALAAGGLRFAQARAHAPWTLPSFGTIFSGELPPEHGAGGVADHYFALRSEVRTWPECFRDAGYATAAIVNVDFLSSAFGVTQGFDALDARFSEDNARGRDARATTDAALARLEARGSAPFALFVHYFDAHAEYRPPQPFRRRFADPRDTDSEAFRFGTREQISAWRSAGTPPDRDGVERAEKLYDGEVAYVDAEIGRLLEGLRAAGLERDTLVVLTADHGEEFLDHGGIEHGHTLHEELLHVPLVLSWPGVLAARVETRPVGLVGLARSLCRLCEVEPAAGFSKAELLAEPGPRELLEEGFSFGNFWGLPWTALREDGWCWISIPRKGAPERVELYDLRSDPLEQQDLAAQRPEQAARMAARVEELRTRAREENWRMGPPAQLGEEALQRIRDTGYGGESREVQPK
ncbi:MAG: sulfatase-like hydrolase/transferase [Planctomycetes bacterium]|nr:sulfatase-like hydrolase/transferase [Planctomycetota bacterium]